MIASRIGIWPNLVLCSHSVKESLLKASESFLFHKKKIWRERTCLLPLNVVDSEHLPTTDTVAICDQLRMKPVLERTGRRARRTWLLHDLAEQLDPPAFEALDLSASFHVTWDNKLFTVWADVSFLKKKLFNYLAVLGLSCGMWDLVPWPGIEPGPSALGA